MREIMLGGAHLILFTERDEYVSKRARRVSAPLIGYLIDLFGVRTTFLVCSVFPLISIIMLIVFRKFFVNGLEVSSN